MTPEHVNAFVLLAALGLLIATIYGPWQWYCVERARQKIFEVRARIFNLAADGQITFDSSEYLSIRESLNVRLRFAHRISWQQMLLVAWTYPNLPMESDLMRQIRSIKDRELREILEKEARRSARAMAELVILRSPPLLLLYIIFRCVHRLHGKPRKPEWRQYAGERASIDAERVGPILDRRGTVRAA